MITQTPLFNSAPAEPEPGNPATSLAAAADLFSRGEYEQAAHSLKLALQKHPGDFDLLMGLGNVQYHAKDGQGALNSFTAAARQRPQLALPHLSRAAVLLEAGDCLEGEGAVRLGLSIEPGNVSGLKLLARFLLDGRRFKDAIPTFEAVLKQQDNDIQSWLMLGRCRYELGDADGARRAFEKVLVHDPANSIAADNLAVLARKAAPEATTRSGAASLRRPDASVDARLDGLIREIGAGDEMFTGDKAHYFGVGESALHCIDAAFFTARKQRERVRRILDLPCGHGRVMRFLRAAFPQALITACDLNRSAVDFCAKTFDAQPVYSHVEVGRIPLSGRFDLIWCGSLLTHLRAEPCAALVRFFNSILEPGGLLLFTVHGRWVERSLATGRYNYSLPPERITELLREYSQTGFGYTDYPSSPGYGISVSSPGFVMTQLVSAPDLRLVTYHEKGWDQHQDVVCLQKQPITEPLA